MFKVYSERMQLTKQNINDDICRQLVKSSWGLVTWALLLKATAAPPTSGLNLSFPNCPGIV